MSDIVIRLENGYPGLYGNDYDAAVFKDRSDALDEIERLRSDLSRQIDITTQQANEIERLRALTEWRPIESAPEDLYLLFFERSGHTNFVFQGIKLEGNVWANGSPYDSACGWEPTHWMPLPPPPKE